MRVQTSNLNFFSYLGNIGTSHFFSGEQGNKSHTGRSSVIMVTFWRLGLLKNSVEILNKLKSKGFQASGMISLLSILHCLIILSKKIIEQILTESAHFIWFGVYLLDFFCSGIQFYLLLRYHLFIS